MLARTNDESRRGITTTFRTVVSTFENELKHFGDHVTDASYRASAFVMSIHHKYHISVFFTLSAFRDENFTP
jgi:hypothetical protein